MRHNIPCEYNRADLTDTICRLQKLFDEGQCPHISVDRSASDIILVVVDSWCGLLRQDGAKLCQKGPLASGYVAGSSFARDPIDIEITIESQNPGSLMLACEIAPQHPGGPAWNGSLRIPLALDCLYGKREGVRPLENDVPFKLKRADGNIELRSRLLVGVKRTNSLPAPYGDWESLSHAQPVFVYLGDAPTDPTARTPHPSESPSAVPPNDGAQSAETGTLLPSIAIIQPEVTRRADVLIVTALQEEYLAVRKRLDGLDEIISDKGTVYEIGRYHSSDQAREAVIVQVGRGNVGTAIETERAISIFQPSLVFFVGIAGGLKDVKVGDVVAATKVYGYERGRDGVEFQARPDVWRSAARLLHRAQAIARNNDWLENAETPDWLCSSRAFVAPIAGGQKVVASEQSNTAKLIQSHYGDALAVEMEGVGFLEAAHKGEAKGLVVRGISDLLKGQHETSEPERQTVAAEVAAAFAFAVLRQMDERAYSNPRAQ